MKKVGVAGVCLEFQKKENSTKDMCDEKPKSDTLS